MVSKRKFYQKVEFEKDEMLAIMTLYCKDRTVSDLVNQFVTEEMLVGCDEISPDSFVVSPDVRAYLLDEFQRYKSDLNNNLKGSSEEFLRYLEEKAGITFDMYFDIFIKIYKKVDGDNELSDDNECNPFVINMQVIKENGLCYA